MVKITEKELGSIIIKTLNKLFSNGSRRCICECYLDEMGKINLHPSSREDILPYPRFFVFINNGDHNPPHIHVEKKDKTYHATFRIDNGKTLQIKTKNHLDIQTHLFCEKEIPKWLERSTLVNGKTNREVCLEEWIKENPGQEIWWNA